MDTADFLTLAGEGHAQTRIKASVFLALAAPVESEDAVRAVLEAWTRPRFDATHHCTAWRLRGGLWRANDGGEPSGSAGAPILAALDGAGLVDVFVVVTRYYGGTKLGVGGLIRAYGEAAALALADAPKRAGTPAARLRIRYAYLHTSAVMRVLELLRAEEIEHGFAAGGAEGEVCFTLAAAGEAALHRELRERTGAAVAAERLGERVLYRDAGG